MILLDKVMDLTIGRPLVLAIALFAAPCYTVAGESSGADTLASTRSAAATKQPAPGQDAEIRPFRVNIPQTALDDLRRRLRATNWAREGARDGSFARRAARRNAGTRPLLGD